MIAECDICGEEKVCKEYVCKLGVYKGKVYEDNMILCKECVKIQEAEGEVEEVK